MVVSNNSNNSNNSNGLFVVAVVAFFVICLFAAAGDAVVLFVCLFV